jgi:hypothetical protein
MEPDFSVLRTHVGHQPVFDRDQAAGVADPFECESCQRNTRHRYYGFRAATGQLFSVAECPLCGHQSEY